MRKLILLLSLLVGCDQAYQRNIENNTMPVLRYIYDNETKLCFVHGWQEYGRGNNATGGPILSYVPCTEEVMKKISAK